MEGLINFYHLEEWFDSAFSENQKRILYNYFPIYLTQGTFFSIYSYPIELLKIIDFSNEDYRNTSELKDIDERDFFDCRELIYSKAYISYQSVITHTEELFDFFQLALINFHVYKSFWDNTSEVKELCNKCIDLSEPIIKIYKERQEKLPRNEAYSELYRIESNECNWTASLILCQKAKAEGWPGQWTRLINHCSTKIDESFLLVQDKNKPRNIISKETVLELITSSPFKYFLFYDNNIEIIDEPSMIYSNLEVCKAPEGCTIPRLYAFPAYSQMLPEQRYEYLLWLQDITKPIGTSYVFLFFYGLERLLFFKDYSEYNFDSNDLNNISPTSIIIHPESSNQVYYYSLLSIISLLRKYHNNFRFQELSMDSCIRSIIFRENKSLLEKYFDYESKNSCYFTYLYYYFKFKEFPILNSREIAGTAKYVGFTNDHYIKKDFNKFSDVLESILMEKTGQITFDLSTYSKKLETKRNSLVYFGANPAFNHKYDYYFFNVFRNKKLSEFLYDLIKTTHETIRTKKLF